ncbi:hypothetical protein HYE68_003793 [Fusarium pseudograminearum]|nr:hypothetical protein HYE68_003793 [Fusarium pseudograminearum]
METVSLLCDGFAFAIPESTAKRESPVLSKAIENLPEAQMRVIPVTEFDLDAVNCFVEFLNTGQYEVNQSLFPSVVKAGIGKPPQTVPFTRDFLIRHVTMSKLGQHFQVHRLSEHARDQIEMILRRQWSDGAFLGATNIALTHTNDHELHKLLWSQARSHLHSLTATSEFDPATFLRSFHSRLRTRTEPEPVSASSLAVDSVEVAKLKERISLLEKQVSDTCIERDEHQKRASSLCVERDELEFKSSELPSKRDDSRHLEETTQRFKSQISTLQQQVSELSKERDGLCTSIEAESRSRREAENDTKEAQEQTRNALSSTQTALARFEQATKRLAEANERYNASEADHTAKAQIAHTKLSEAEKSLSTSETELRITSSERNLLRQRWKEEKVKSSGLTKEIDELKLVIDLERSVKDTVPTTVRDELKRALEAEQAEVKRLNKELEKSQRSVNNAATINATTSMSQAQRDSLYESLGAEKNKVINPTKERDQATREKDRFWKQLTDEVDEKLRALDKIEALIECLEEYENCRHCNWGFGIWVEDDGSKLVVRCDRCRTRHWKD